MIMGIIIELISLADHAKEPLDSCAQRKRENGNRNSNNSNKRNSK